MACASVPAQATESTSTPTAAPTDTGEQASAEPTHTPTPTASGGRDSGSDPEPTETPTPTPIPEPVSGPEPPATTTPAVTLGSVDPTEPPLGDCFGGALSGDPMHCYVLEQAQAAGLIDILGVYVDDGDGTVYVSLSQARLSAEMVEFADEQSYAFYDAWPRLTHPDVYWRLACGESRMNWPDCYLTPHRRWYEDGYLFLSPPAAYGGFVMLVPGAADGLHQVRGWASWRQLWPRVSARQGAGGRGTDGGPAFDVSDVDVTNFPDMDCSREITSVCDQWKKLPDVGIAGFHWSVNSNDHYTWYFQVKNPPADEAELEALKDRLAPCHDVIGDCTYTDERGATWRRYNEATTTVEIIPVKYDYRDLWRWKTILKRFAVSAGNTLGIMDARVDSTKWRPNNYDTMYVNGVPWAGESGVTEYGLGLPAHTRETIVVGARELQRQRVADALPALLPLLGVPVDAVGIVSLWIAGEGEW